MEAQLPGDGGRPPGAHPVRLVVTDDLQRKRLTVFFRLFLVIPHFIWLGLWSIAAFFAALANWLVTLLRGRPPADLHRFLSLYVKYGTHVYGYFLLGASPYPHFDGSSGYYPVDLEIDPPVRQPRATVAFRLILVVPAILLGTALFGVPNFSSRSGTSSYEVLGVAHAAAFLGWFVCVALRRMPRGLRDCVTWGVGFAAQLWAYLLVLTSAYPDSDPEVVLGELPVREDPIALRVEEGLRRSRLTVFFRLPLTFPHLVWLALWSVLALPVAIANWVATLVLGRAPRPLHRFLASYLRYETHVNAFLWLTANPFPGFAGASGSYPVEVGVAEPQRQNRWTVLLRLPAVIPAWIIASALGSVLWIAALLGWFAALATGRMPRSLRNTQLQALRCEAQATAYVLLLTGAYPYLGPASVPGAGGRAGNPGSGPDPAAAFG